MTRELRSFTLHVELDVDGVLAVVGPSGAGKSTLLRGINHLETIDDGTIHFEGKPVYRYQQNGKTVVDPDRRIEAIRALYVANEQLRQEVA